MSVRRNDMILTEYYVCNVESIDDSCRKNRDIFEIVGRLLNSKWHCVLLNLFEKLLIEIEEMKINI